MKERRRFSSSAAPTEPGRSDAPISATERGSRKRATAEVAATRSRSSNAASASAPSAVGSSTSTTPDRARTEAGNPLSRKTSTMRRLSARTRATKSGMPARRACSATRPRRTVPSPWPCHASATAKATSALSVSIRTYIACATIRPSGPIATSPTRSRPSTSTACLAAARRLTPSDRNRKARESGDRAERKSCIASSSAGSSGRTCSVEPSRRTTSWVAAGRVGDDEVWSTPVHPARHAGPKHPWKATANAGETPDYRRCCDVVASGS